MKKILFLLLPLIPALALAQTGTVKDSVRVLTTAEIQAGQASDTANFYFIQNGQWRKINMDSLDSFLRRKRAGDRGDIDVSTDGLTWTVDTNAIVAVDIQNGAVDSTKLALGAVVLPGAKVTGTLPVSKGGTGSTTLAGAGIVTKTDTSTISGGVIFRGTVNAIDTSIVSSFRRIVQPHGLIGAGSGQLTALSTATISAGTNPISVTVDPTGRFVYVANYSSNTVSQYSINQTTGQLAALSTATISAGTNPYSVTVDPTGRFVYVTNYSSNTVSQYTIQNFSAGGAFIAGRLSIGVDSAQTNYKVNIGTAARPDSLYVGGNVSASAYTTRSDLEIKEDIEPLPYGIKEILQLQPVRYTQKSTNTKNLGFIAQDVGMVIDEAISWEDTKSVFYQYFIPILVKAIKEQQSQINTLQQKIIQLENK